MNESTTASLPLLPTSEDVAIRKSLQTLCASFDQRYLRACFEKNEPASELWDALAKGGFVGVNMPEAWGGGGLGMHGLQIVAEEVACRPTVRPRRLIASRHWAKQRCDAG